jgi:maleate isomerase
MDQINARDTLGHRCVMGVVAPATNTAVQAEMDGLRLDGVINAHARIANPEQRVAADADTLAVRAAMVSGLMGAVDTLAPCRPDHVILGVMVENFVGGGAAGAALIRNVGERLGCGVTDYSSAIILALEALFGRKVRIGLLTPFLPVGDAAARRIFEEAGHEVVRLIGLRAPSPASIGRMPLNRMHAAVAELNGPEVDVIIQVGTGLPFAGVARAAEAEIGKPVLASNPVSYWRALRQVGITDTMPQQGRLFAL